MVTNKGNLLSGSKMNADVPYCSLTKTNCFILISHFWQSIVSSARSPIPSGLLLSEVTTTLSILRLFMLQSVGGMDTSTALYSVSQIGHLNFTFPLIRPFVFSSDISYSHFFELLFAVDSITCQSPRRVFS